MFGHNDDDQQVGGGGQHQDNDTASNNPIAQASVAQDSSTVVGDTSYSPGAGDTTYASVSAVPDTDNDEQFASASPVTVLPAVPSVPSDQTYDPYSLPSATPTNTTSTNNVSSEDASDLLSLKQQALKQLSPLVNHLDQSAEEKFKTTMMMIQASDDKSLLKNAYETAQEIPDEKARAQALLDVVNEINYFTQAN